MTRESVGRSAARTEKTKTIRWSPGITTSKTSGDHLICTYNTVRAPNSRVTTQFFRPCRNLDAGECGGNYVGIRSSRAGKHRRSHQHADFARGQPIGVSGFAGDTLRVQPCGNRVGAEQCESCAERLAEPARCRNALLRVARPAPLLVQLGVGEEDQCALIGGASAVLPMPASPEIRTSRPRPKKSASRERCLLALTRHEQWRVVPVVEVRRSVHTWSRPRSPHWW